MFNKLISAAGSLVLLTPTVHAFFRINCANIQVARVDPIVNPGKISGHVHTVQGGANFGVNATYESLQQSACASCQVQDDKSAYWTPLLYYQFENGSVIDVPQSGSVLYYIGRGVNQKNIQPFPPGFRMISGDASARSFNDKTMTWGNKTFGSRPAAERVNFACLSTSPGKSTPGLNRTDCVNGLRAQIHFQSCWDGVNLYKSDQSHVAYMSQIDNGACPPTHPVQLMHLFIETSYQVNKIPKQAGGRFVFSTGDPTGYSFHADFQNGWNMTTLERAIASCGFNDNSSGDLNECPPLMESVIDNFSSQCPTRPSQIDETVTGLLPKLPGCVKIVDGPAPASPTDLKCGPDVTDSRIIPTPDTKPIVYDIPVPGQPYGAPGWNYIGCANDTQSGRVMSADTFANASVTVELCQSYCARKEYKYAGLEMGNQCFCDNYLANNPVYNAGSFNEGKCYYSCAGDAGKFCGGKGRIDIYDLATVVQVPLPSVQAKSGTYVHKGCFKEAATGRALSNYSTNSASMTVDACAKVCLGRSFKYFGVEFGKECYCGSSLNSAGPANLTDCNSRCAGNAGLTQSFCGGPSKLNVYYSHTL